MKLKLLKRIKGWTKAKPCTPFERYHDFKGASIVAFFGILICVVGISSLRITELVSIRFMTMMLGAFIAFFLLALAWSLRGVKKFRREYEVKVSVKRRAKAG